MCSLGKCPTWYCHPKARFSPGKLSSVGQQRVHPFKSSACWSAGTFSPTTSTGPMRNIIAKLSCSPEAPVLPRMYDAELVLCAPSSCTHPVCPSYSFHQCPMIVPLYIKVAPPSPWACVNLYNHIVQRCPWPLTSETQHVSLGGGEDMAVLPLRSVI